MEEEEEKSVGNKSEDEETPNRTRSESNRSREDNRKRSNVRDHQDLVDGKKGKTSEEAQQQLIKELTDFIRKERKRVWLGNLAIQNLLRITLTVNNVLTAIACGLLFAAFAVLYELYYFSLRLIAEGVILFAFIIYSIGLSFIIRYSQSMSSVNRALSFIKAVGTYEDEYDVQRINTMVPHPQPFVRVWRDNQLVSLLPALLVQGDVIRVTVGEVLPSNVICVDNPEEEYEKGLVIRHNPNTNELDPHKQSDPLEDEHFEEVNERNEMIINDNEDEPKSRALSTNGHDCVSREFLIKDSPALVMIKEHKGRRQLEPFKIMIRQWRIVLIIVLLLGLIPLLTVSAVKFGVQSENEEFAYLLLIRPATYMIPLLSIFLPFAVAFMTVVGNAVLLAHFHDSQKRARRKRLEDAQEENKEKGKEPEAERDAVSSSSSSSSSSSGFFSSSSSSSDSEASGRDSFDEYDEIGSKNSMEMPKLKVRQRYVWKYLLALLGESTYPFPGPIFPILGAITTLCEIEHSAHITDGMRYVEKVCFFEKDNSNPTIFELSRDPNSPGTSRFNDSEWKDHLSSLKPIGLNILLSGCCKFGQYPGTSVVDKDKAPQDLDVCLCCTAKAIGFQEGALDSFTPSQRLHLTDTSKTMVGVVVSDSRSNSLQLLSKGDPAILLWQCATYWDGQGVVSLTDEVRNKILYLERQWRGHKCIAFSYRPITARDLTGAGIMSQQIFIGMVALRIYPYLGVPSAVSRLKHHGIRFVHITADGKEESRIFAEKMGLETDWNCSISLSEPDGKHDAHHDLDFTATPTIRVLGLNIETDQSPARLPRGIDSIARHIEHIDNVPLLVPLYYDANEMTASELIKIFQNHGDIVMCIGDILSLGNSRAFDAADISVGVDTTPPKCWLETQNEPLSERMVSSSRQLREGTNGSLAVDLASLHVPLVSNNMARLESMANMMMVARSLVKKCNHSINLYCQCCITMSLIVLLSAVAFTPIIYMPIHTLYYTTFFLPLVIFNLLRAHSDPKITSEISAKHIKKDYKEELKRKLSSFPIRFGPIIVSVFLLFIWTIALLWDDFTWSKLFGFAPRDDVIDGGIDEDVLWVSQCLAVFSLSHFTVVIGFNFTQERIGFLNRDRRKLISLRWSVGSVLLTILNIGIIIAVVAPWIHEVITKAYPMIIVTFFFPGFFLLLEEYLKYRYRIWYKEEQQFRHLEFNTKLGMYSPVSPFRQGNEQEHDIDVHHFE